MDKENIGNFIRTLRKEKHLTQDELADKLFITRENISKWERGVTIPNTSYLNELCKILDVSLNELLSGKRVTSKKDHNKEIIIILSIIVILETIIISILISVII